MYREKTDSISYKQQVTIMVQLWFRRLAILYLEWDILVSQLVQSGFVRHTTQFKQKVFSVVFILDVVVINL